MRGSTMRGLAAGGMLGVTIGAGLMMTPQGKRMKRVLKKDAVQMLKDVRNIWMA